MGRKSDHNYKLVDVYEQNKTASNWANGRAETGERTWDGMIWALHPIGSEESDKYYTNLIQQHGSFAPYEMWVQDGLSALQVDAASNTAPKNISPGLLMRFRSYANMRSAGVSAKRIFSDETHLVSKAFEAAY